MSTETIDIEAARAQAKERAETRATEESVLITCLLFERGRTGWARPNAGDVVHAVEGFSGARWQHATVGVLRSLRERRLVAFDGVIADCDTCGGEGKYSKGRSTATASCDDCNGRGVRYHISLTTAGLALTRELLAEAASPTRAS
jgi:hypothetical protein